MIRTLERVHSFQTQTLFSALLSNQSTMTLSLPKATVSKRKRNTTKPTEKAAEVSGDFPKSVVRCRRAKPPSKRKDEVTEDMEDLFKFKGKKQIVEMRQNLLDWYDRNKRDLPWRRLGDNSGENEEEGERRAYGVWVSEVMLQQTRVATVIDYFNRWMERWPSLHHLSLASLEEVNEMWAGLGYYRRARYLLEGAKKIAEEGGRFPRTVSSLRKIPGIGDYTAGAIASIAFSEEVPVVDGNVVRVLARIKAISENPKDRVVVKGFWKLAEQLVDPCRPGDFNQALMELGATICTPMSPSCSACPLNDHCEAFSLSQCCSSSPVTDYPQKVIKTKQRHEFSAVCVLEISDSLDGSIGSSSNQSYVLVKRPEEGLLAGLWEFPSVLFKEDTDVVARRNSIDHLLKSLFSLEPKKTCTVILREYVGEYVHVFSHIRLKMYVELMTVHLKDGKDQFCNKMNDTSVYKCVDTDGLSNMGLTSGIRKVYEMVQKFKQDNVVSDSVTQKSNKQSKVGRK